jgi:hypothetical protein
MVLDDLHRRCRLRGDESAWLLPNGAGSVATVSADQPVIPS